MNGQLRDYFEFILESKDLTIILFDSNVLIEIIPKLKSQQKDVLTQLFIYLISEGKKNSKKFLVNETILSETSNKISNKQQSNSFVHDPILISTLNYFTKNTLENKIANSNEYHIESFGFADIFILIDAESNKESTVFITQDQRLAEYAMRRKINCIYFESEDYCYSNIQ